MEANAEAPAKFRAVALVVEVLHSISEVELGIAVSYARPTSSHFPT